MEHKPLRWMNDARMNGQAAVDGPGRRVDRQIEIIVCHIVCGLLWHKRSAGFRALHPEIALGLRRAGHKKKECQ